MADDPPSGEGMDRLMPKWQHFRRMLNALPLRYEEWSD
jgi:hypothetical protein